VPADERARNQSLLARVRIGMSPLLVVRSPGRRPRSAATPLLLLAAASALVFPLAAAACDDPPAEGPLDRSSGEAGASAAPTVDPDVTQPDTVIGALAARYLDDVQMNRTPFQTASHLGNPQVNVFATARAEAAYRRITPGGEAPADFVFPTGSLLVKEMLDADGGPPILTVMYKQPPGYDPPHDDWWFGRLRADGTPTDPAFVGRVGFCADCHAGSRPWDFVWGLPEGNKSAVP
jgi:hypothetical protein